MNFLLKKILRGRKILREHGWQILIPFLKKKFHTFHEKRKYQKYIQKFERLTTDERRQILRNVENLSRKPLISIILPVYNVDEKWLRLCLESVRKQIYPYWELCIADDASPSPHIRKVLNEFASQEKRLKIVFRHTNGHISAASNSALKLATGDFAVLLDHDDELHETALYHIVKEINDYPNVQMIYSDEDFINQNGKRFAPKFKPDWSPDFFYSLNLITHLSAYQTSLLKEIGGFRLGTEGSQDYDLALRVTEKVPPENIRHIPLILYHWRAIQGSTALSGDEKPYAHDRARQVINEHFHRKNIAAQTTNGYSFLHRAVYDIPKDLRISVILSADNFSAVRKFLPEGNSENIEIIGIGEKPENHPQIKIIAPQKNIAESLNCAVAEATGDVLVFLESDITPLNNNWLHELVSLARQKEIGVVGGKILNSNATIRNAGIILGINNLFGFAHRGYPAFSSGDFLRLVLINNYAGFSGVYAVKREIFGHGFNSKIFPNGIYEIDFCLHVLHKLGLRNVFTPYAEFVQKTESATEKVLRENSAEVLRFREKWQSYLEKDSYYNPNLSLADEEFSIADTPRISKF